MNAPAPNPAVPRAVVVGAGLGGIAAALRLRKKGYAVTLLDKQDQLGGRASVYRRNGFVFDAGPTVVTAPFLFDELFALFGKRREDYVTFTPLYPWYRIQFADKSTFDYGGTLEQTLAQINQFDPTGRDAAGYLKLLAHTKKIFETGFLKLGDQPFETLWSMLKVSPDLARLGTWRTVWQMTAKYIKNENLRRVLSFQPLLVGGNPFNTTSIYSLIHYLEREWGVHFAMGGTGAIVAALGKLMEEEGIEIRLGQEVSQIYVDAGGAGQPTYSVGGVNLANGESVEADLVVCNADAPFTYRNLIARSERKKWTDRRIDKMQYSMGLFVLYFGTTKQYADVAHHTIILGHKYGDLLHEMFDQHKLEMTDLSVYLHRPTATDPSMAPPGCDSFYVLCPVPNLQGDVDWNEMGPKYRDLVVDYLERTHLPGLRDCITEDFYVTPTHFRDNLNTLHGTGFSIQPTFRQSAYWRFHNRSEDVDGLYLVGAGTHPGAGMPGVLCSAKVLDRLIPTAPTLNRT